LSIEGGVAVGWYSLPTAILSLAHLEMSICVPSVV
jgi:hypothetical protein